MRIILKMLIIFIALNWFKRCILLTVTMVCYIVRMSRKHVGVRLIGIANKILYGVGIVILILGAVGGSKVTLVQELKY